MAIVEAVIAMARHMGFNVTAEVESASNWSFCRHRAAISSRDTSPPSRSLFPTLNAMSAARYAVIAPSAPIKIVWRSPRA
jgi:hypothetical protein